MSFDSNTTIRSSSMIAVPVFFFFFQAEDGIRDHCVTGVQTCALPISLTKVRHLRYLIGSSFHCSVELRECQDRDIKLTCHILESTRYLGDFLVSLTNEIGRAACRGRG